MKQLTEILKFYIKKKKMHLLISKGIENLIVNFLTIEVNIYIHVSHDAFFIET